MILNYKRLNVIICSKELEPNLQLITNFMINIIILLLLADKFMLQNCNSTRERAPFKTTMTEEEKMFISYSSGKCENI